MLLVQFDFTYGCDQLFRCSELTHSYADKFSISQSGMLNGTGTTRNDCVTIVTDNREGSSGNRKNMVKKLGRLRYNLQRGRESNEI